MSCFNASKLSCRSTPLSNTVPSLGSARPARMFISVDLPEPFAPMMQTNSDGRTRRLAVSRIRCGELLPRPRRTS